MAKQRKPDDDNELADADRALAGYREQGGVSAEAFFDELLIRRAANEHDAKRQTFSRRSKKER